MRSETEIRKNLETIEFLYETACSLNDGSITTVDLEKNKTMISTLKWVLGDK